MSGDNVSQEDIKICFVIGSPFSSDPKPHFTLNSGVSKGSTAGQLSEGFLLLRRQIQWKEKDAHSFETLCVGYM